jgi:hypothetical protein
LFVNLNYDFPFGLDERFTACNFWNELIPLHIPEHDGRDQHLDRKWNGFLAEDDKVLNCEGEMEASEFPQRISQFLDDPLPHPSARHYRIRPRCIKLSCDEARCDAHNQLFPSLLIDVCQVVSDEVKYLFYSENHFNITSTGHGRFYGLVALQPRALSWLSSLSIELDICICITDPTVSKQSFCYIHDAGEDRSKDLGIPGQEKPLQQAVVRYRSREITEWKLLCRHLASYITPYQLKLWVDVQAMSLDIETAKDFALAMMQLPVLRECGIHFRDQSGLDEFQKLSRHTALKLTGRLANAFNSPFPISRSPS